MHPNDSIYFRLWLSYFGSGEMHAVQGHGAREDHDSTCIIRDSKIIA